MTRVILSRCFITLAILFVWQVQDVAEACFCPPPDPQQALCHADVVIRASVTTRVKIDQQSVKYNVIVTKVFKGPGDTYAVYTALSSAACGVTLTTGEEYLITGHLQADGMVHIFSCNFIKPWKDLSGKLLEMVQDYKHYCG